ncbi:DUF4382 domain-containing protein [Myxococcaceae bacterium GXIMD 01537]
MKRHFVLLAPFLLAACGSDATLDLSVTSDDSSENATSVVSAFAADLSSVKAINLTVSEVWVHVAGGSAADSIDGDGVSDSDKGWEQVSTEERVFDLMTVRNQATKPLGDVSVPEGKITQIRLKLKNGNADSSGKVRLVGAVEETSGTKCDLLVPQSAFDPGVKISGTFKAMKIEAKGKHAAVLNIKLKDWKKLGDAACAYQLNPELKVKKFDVSK